MAQRCAGVRRPRVARDVLDVRIENETLLAPIGNIVAAPSFGMDATHGRRPAATVDEARIAVVLRTRVEPILLTTNRISNIDATEWLKDIHEFLRGCGWRAAEKIEPATEPRTILLLRVDGTEYTIRVKTRASAFVLEALRLDPGEKEATTHEYVIEAEDGVARSRRHRLRVLPAAVTTAPRHLGFVPRS